MGKKKTGAALRAIKRSREALEELQDRQAEEVAKLSVIKAENHELFVIDTAGANVPNSLRPTNLKKQEEKERKKRELSDKDQARVQALLKKHNHSAEALAALAKKGREVLEKRHGGRVARGLRAVDKSAKYDMWEKEASKNVSTIVTTVVAEEKKETVVATGEQVDEKGEEKPVVVPNRKSNSTVVAAGMKFDYPTKKHRMPKPPERKIINVDLAKAGQSYQPDPDAHKAVIDLAVQVELRRNAKEEYLAAPISNGMSAETRALLLSDSDSDDDSDDDSSDNDNEEKTAKDGEVAIKKAPKRKTRAQRNKEKRLRQEKAMLRQKKETKKLLHAVQEAPRLVKELQKVEEERKKDKEQRDAVKKDAKEKPVGRDLEVHISEKNPIGAPTYPVALSSDLERSTSLRAIKPKGSLVTDRMASFTSRMLVPAKRTVPEGEKQRKKKKRMRYKGNFDAKGSDWEVLG